MKMNNRIKEYWEEEANQYSNAIARELESQKSGAWKNLILENAPKKDSLEILDIGTGPGFFPIILSKAGHNVTAIDITENMILRAKENIEKAGQSATILQMDCQALTFADQSFDLVVCRNLTWTLSDPVTAYREWLRVLRPGGRLLVFDACWYLHLYDEQKQKDFAENEVVIWKKYDRKTHSHVNQDECDALGRELFMSDKYRPQWDLKMMIELGFAKVFANLDLSEVIWDEKEKEINKTTPPFLVGGEK